MHKEILTKEQIELLPLIKKFSYTYYLVGGTAIALHLGHRRSIDFDLFSKDKSDAKKINTRILRNGYKIDKQIFTDEFQHTLEVNSVKMTFFQFIYDIPLSEKLDSIVKIPDLLTLGAMKGFALGQRAKWKDYIDLYFIFKKHSYTDVAKKAEQLFGSEFNEKLLKVQLGYFNDIDYREQVDWLPGFEVGEDEVKKYLTEASLGY